MVTALYERDGILLYWVTASLALTISKLLPFDSLVAKPETISFIVALCAGTERSGNRQEDALFQKRHSAPTYKYFAEYAETTGGGTSMKKSSGKYKPPPLLSVIEAARAGEADAMEQILQHYDAYINKLGLRTIVDESGQPHKQVDPYMKGRLQSKLMQAITKK